MISIRKAAGVKGIANVSLRKGSGLKGIANVRLRTASGLKLYHSLAGGSFSLSVSPAAVYGGGGSASAINISTGTCTVTPTGGMAPFTYAWSVVSTDGSLWSIESASSASTRFRCSGVPSGGTRTAVFKCTVTDARGLSAVSGNVDASVTNYGFAT